MLGIGSSKKDLKVQIRKNDRKIKKEIRNLNKDLSANKARKQKLLQQLKKEANEGQQEKVRNTAKRIVRLEKHDDKIDKMTASLEDLQMQMAEMKTLNAMSDAMKDMTKMMGKMSKYLNPQKVAKRMGKFEKARIKNELTQEMMEDVMDDMFDEDVEAEDELVDRVLAEAGLNATAGLASVPVEGAGHAGTQEVNVPIPQGEDDADVSDLEARLRNLNNTDI